MNQIMSLQQAVKLSWWVKPVEIFRPADADETVRICEFWEDANFVIVLELHSDSHGSQLF